MELANNVRVLRLQRGLTQRALAEALGVSDRAVSRWERAQAMPDITLLPRLSALLEVSVDALLGVDPCRRASEIARAQEECTALLQQDDAPAAVQLMRTMSAAWPDEPEVMVYLARALLALHTEEAAREALSLCRRADGRPMRLSSTYGCKQVMALALHHLGQCDAAVKLVSDEMPAIWVCRELMLARVAPPELAQQAHRSNALMLSGILHATLKRLAKATGSDAPAQAAEIVRQTVEASFSASDDE